MEYAQPPGPPADMGMAPAGEAPPDARTLNDPEQYRRYMRERVLETTRAQAAFFERSLLEQEAPRASNNIAAQRGRDFISSPEGPRRKGAGISDFRDVCREVAGAAPPTS